MTKEEIKLISASQREFFKDGATLDIRFRKEALKRLYGYIRDNEEKIKAALHSDLGKSGDESYMCEIGMALSEISHMIKNVAKYSKRRGVKTPLAQFPSKSYVLPSPYGVTLIMSPWNYPFLLSIDPLATSIAAGNTVILKPSAYSPATSELLKELVGECFSPEHIAVITGGRDENRALLEEKFDMIFFTGSAAVGREVLRHAAENLTPCVLELGGKSPCIVDKSANIPLAAKRIVFGKLLNCGQTCVAPDYILCEESVKDKLAKAIIEEIKAQYTTDPISNEAYGKIVNKKHFDRLLGLIDREKTLHGGGYNEEKLKIEPTVMVDVELSDPVMCEEIFGPIIPILTWKNPDEFKAVIDGFGEPLALYIFSEDRKMIDNVTRSVKFGGGCINDTIIHLATSEMGFGGVGESGMGAYHGKRGFDSFSHLKSIVKKSSKVDLKMRYQPYDSEFSKKLIRHFLK